MNITINLFNKIFISDYIHLKKKNFIYKLINFFLYKLINQYKFFFIPCGLKKIPKINYPITSNYQTQVNLIKTFNKNYKQNSFMTYPKLLSLMGRHFNKNENFNFLDFGGENIDCFFALKKRFKNINYFIINQKKYNNIFRKIKSEYFLEKLYILEYKDLNKFNYDFINLGSVLQYINNYDAILKYILNFSKKFILISAAHFYKSKKIKGKFIVKQINMLPNKMYCYFFEIDSFCKIFKNNFKIIFNKKNITAQINYSNFTKDFNNIKYSDLLIKRLTI